MDDRLLTSRDASHYLRDRHGIRREHSTLDKLRSVGGGPSFRRLGRNVYYAAPDLDRWGDITPT